MSLPRPYLRIFIFGAILLLVLGIISSNYRSPATKISSFQEESHVRDPDVHSSRVLLDSGRNISVGTPAPPMPDIVALNLDDMSNLPLKDNSGIQLPKDNDLPVSKRLIPGLIPSIAHFAWCGERWFEFKHYLSILSVIKNIKPDKIVFHYEKPPVMDKLFYFQWMDNLIHDYPFLHLEPMNDHWISEVCAASNENIKIERILRFMEPDGGLYVGENTWITDFNPLMRLVDFDFALDDSQSGYAVLRGGLIGNGTHTELLQRSGIRGKSSSCASVNSLFNGNSKFHCVNVKGGRYNSFFPMHIWDLDDPFGRLTRKIFYGTEEILMPKPDYNELVPNIGHMIWLGGGKMDFVFYLSALSVLYVVEVEVLYIHGDQPPTGPYWEKLKTNDRVKLITRPQPYQIYQGEIEWWFKALMSDIIRVDIMINYGGIYTDTDAIWVKGLTKEDRAYDAVASYDWVDWSYPYPDSVNFGLSYGKKNAPFWRIFRDSMRTLHNDIHGFTGVMMPYKLLERFPHLLKIDRHLQVICYQFRCHPTWVDDYHNMTKDHVTMNSIPNWREDVNAFHWTHPNPPEYANETMLLNSKGLFAEIGQFVLKKAGLIP